MAKQVINIGSAANDGTGDALRDAFDKTNDNFTELYDGKLDVDGSGAMTGDLVMAEQADHSSTPGAGYGYLWVKSDTPSSLIFTDDAGTDYDLTDITSTPEGTAILSTGETGGVKFLREDGDNSCSWQAIPAPEGTSVLSTGPVTDGYVLTADGAGGAAWEAAAGGGSGAYEADADTQITPTTPIVLDHATNNEVAHTINYTTNKTAGDDTGLLIDLTDTASPGTSYPLDVQLNGATEPHLFTVDNRGQLGVGGMDASNTHKFYSGSGNAVQLEYWKGNTRAGATRQQLLAFNNAGGMIFRHENDISSGNVYTFNSGSGDELTDTDAEQAFMYIEPKINQSGTAGYTALKVDVTETATGSGNNLLADFQVGGSSKFTVSNAGDITIPNARMVKSLSGEFYLRAGSLYVAAIDSSPKNFALTADTGLAWSDNVSTFATRDLFLYRDAANTLALRNSTNAQTFNVYNTYTDASNYERGFMKWNTNVLEIGTEAAGTGTARQIKLITGSTTVPVEINTENNVYGLKFYNSSTNAKISPARNLSISHYQDISAGSLLTLTSEGSATELTDSNGQQSMLYVQSRVNQSGTAAFDAIHVDTAEEAFGDGTTGDGNNLLRLSSLGTTQWKVDTDGVMTVDSAGHTVATLPTGSVGMIARVTDASSPSVGSTVTGGGAAAALCWYNGSSWTVCGV